MTRDATRRWFLVHKWTSLICTAFLLMLCITGLPLIFHDEIDMLTESGTELAAVPPGTEAPGLDGILRTALADRPGHVGLFMSFDEDRPVVNVTTGPRPDAPGAEMTLRSYDLRSGDLVGVITEDGVMHFLLQLHTDMFLGLPGMFFLGAMGALFFAAIVSGTVLYAPFMWKLDFGTVRADRSRRVKWIDYHNLLGIVTLAWASVVGLTGVINALENPIVGNWRSSELGEMTARYAGQTTPAIGRMASLDGALATARAAAPGNRAQFIAFPGGSFSSAYHYAIFMQGDTPLTKGLLRPALIDATNGALSDIRSMPWYVQALFLSRPLHFGDYGGLPLKILWAVLDIFTIIVLGSGLYLWLGKRRASADAHVREVETGAVVPAE